MLFLHIVHQVLLFKQAYLAISYYPLSVNWNPTTQVEFIYIKRFTVLFSLILNVEFSQYM